MTDTTHAPGCWSWGPRHYECALREIERLRAEVEVWKASFEQAASGHAMYAERTEQLEKVLAAIRDALAKEGE